MANIPDKKKKIENRLVNEKSPYLLQHANNPVNWYPWGEEAFKKAKSEDKPIFLSIGYSTCHWCHVMEKESFEDPEVAELINDAFISIKVDREERPDIDSVYMSVCQMITGSGGWPLSIFMTPDKKPFYAATYLPKESRFGRSGLRELIPYIKQLWEKRRDDLISTSNQIAFTLKQVPKAKHSKQLDESSLKLTFNQLFRNYDRQYGGFGGAPKFPSPHNLMYLLRYKNRYGLKNAIEVVEKTLVEMRKGGIYDHLGNGFHRYSTDAKWLVPHFEKMLYDQALLAMAYVETYQATGNDEFAQTASEIFEYVIRDMTSPEGGFYSAEDADSEGEEGKFYTWTDYEIKKILLKDEVELALKVFNVSEDGNYTDPLADGESKKNILHLIKTRDELIKELNLTDSEYTSKLETIRQKLFNIRESRIHPHKDDKILTDWNGLMIAALAKGGQVLDDTKYIKAAESAAEFISKNMQNNDGRLLHRYRDGEAAIMAHLDDYSFFIWGIIELYETTFNEKYLEEAKKLNSEMMEYFWDEEDKGFYFTAKDAEKLLTREKDVYDGAVPSGNSVALLNLIRLAKLLREPTLEASAEELLSAFSNDIGPKPAAHTMFMIGLDFALGPSNEVVIRGEPDSTSTIEIIKALRKYFIPKKVVLLNPSEKASNFNIPIPSDTEAKKFQSEKAIVYVCTNYSCQEPTSDVGRMLELLKGKKHR